MGKLCSALMLLLVAGCADDDSNPDGALMDGGDPTDTSLEDTSTEDVFIDSCEGPPGLYAPGDCTELAPGVQPYRPAYALWTDGVNKERFIYLPLGSVIDASDPDGWIFPMGTRLYKTFALSGVRLETRLLEKIRGGEGYANWEMRAFLWTEDQSSVRQSGDEETENVLGTNHDVPSQVMCQRCHSGARDGVNGFSAIQLGGPESGGLTLRVLNDRDQITPALSVDSAHPPGEATARSALGYLHANCSHCHRPGAPAGDLTGLHFQLEVDLSDVSETAAFTTAVDVRGDWVATGAQLRIAPGEPDASTVLRRMISRDPAIQMPPIGTELVDPEGLTLVQNWVEQL